MKKIILAILLASITVFASSCSDSDTGDTVSTASTITESSVNSNEEISYDEIYDEESNNVDDNNDVSAPVKYNTLAFLNESETKIIICKCDKSDTIDVKTVFLNNESGEASVSDCSVKVHAPHTPFELSPNILWITGDYTSASNGYLFCVMNDYNYETVLLKTTDGGKTWNEAGGDRSLISEYYFKPTVLKFVTDNIGMIAYGSNGRYVDFRDEVKITLDGGNTWNFSLKDATFEPSEYIDTPDFDCDVYDFILENGIYTITIYASSDSNGHYKLYYNSTDLTEWTLGEVINLEETSD